MTDEMMTLRGLVEKTPDGVVTFTVENAKHGWIGHLCGGDLAPSRERLRSQVAKGAAGDQVALDIEVVEDGGMGGKEPLRRAW